MGLLDARYALDIDLIKELVEERAVRYKHVYRPHCAAELPPLHRAVPIRIHFDKLLHCAARLASKRVAQQPTRVLAGGDVRGGVEGASPDKGA